MKRRLILHIGRHKTGTKSLQYFLSENDFRLLEYYGLLYPMSGRQWGYHHPVFRSLIHENRMLNYALVDSIFREAETAGANCVLLSSEMLSRATVTESQLQSIKSAFSKFDVAIVIYLRPQPDFLESIYAQWVKTGACAYPQDIHTVAADSELNYFDFVKKYSTVFGKENVVVRACQKGRDFSIFEDFLKAVGYKWQGTFITPDHQLNRRFPWTYVEILRYANMNRIARDLVLRRLARRTAKFAARIMPAVFDKPRPLSQEERDQIIREYEESNSQLAMEYLGRPQLFD